MKHFWFILALVLPMQMPAAALKEAEVTRIINDVRLVPPSQASATAKAKPRPGISSKA